MLQSTWSPLFWIAVVILGMVIPVTAVINSIVTGLEGISMAFLYAAIFSGLIGDLAIRYLILRCGVYGPLIPSSTYA
jgi:formate-dependent nitrite reductase membrane component NrfD